MKSLFIAAVAAFLVVPQAHAHSIDVVVSLAERVPLSELAANVTNPRSERYGVYYTPAEIRALVAPTDQQYADLVSNLQADGFEVVNESSTHLSLTIRGSHSKFERIFATEIQFFPDKTHANMRDVQIPDRYSLVKSLRGLDSTRRKHHHLRFAEKSKATKQGGILPAQIKTAYGFDPIYKAGYTGKGQHIAVATYMGFHLEDVQAYYKKVGLPVIPTVDQVQFNGAPAYDDDSAAETQLDAEFTGMIAPGASVHVFASAENSDAGELAMFTAILDDGRANVVNYSWGGCETGVDPAHKSDMDAVYARAIAQGVNILVASGDSGSDGCGNNTTVADWPATNPDVVAVGGTTVKLSSDNQRESEIGWGSIDSQTGHQEGSGGGVSSLYATPDWQTGLPSQFGMRSFPDVAFNADPASGEAIWTHNGSSKAHWLVLGGTSMATPQWAGFLALVNEARVSKGSSTLGFLNPLIYGAQNQAGLFNDITSGSNGAYSAGQGWDAVTGLGSQQADSLLEFLVGT